jgi:predicted N-acetyltransferase YhbS
VSDRRGAVRAASLAIQEDDVFSAALVAAEESEVVTHLAIPPVAFGLTAFAVLGGLLAVTYAFRSVWTRH